MAVRRMKETLAMRVDDTTKASFVTLLINTEHPSVAAGLERAGLWDTVGRRLVGRFDASRMEKALDNIPRQ
eukprot:2727108-Rhodomonas_salina.1